MSAVVITRTPFGGSPQDITSHVIIESASFQSQLAAIPGSFEFTCKDLTQTLSFVTGDEISLTVDGTKLFGGYVTQLSRTYAFEADNTTPVSTFDSRYFVVRGVDYNILFDNRRARNPANYLGYLPLFDYATLDGPLLTFFLNNYIDVPSGFDTSTHVDAIRTIPHGSDTTQGSYVQQGDTLRSQFEEFAQFSGAIYYIDANKNFHWHSIENSESRWGFSDVPNRTAITASPASYQGATYGFREIEAIEDGSVIVNDALVWGGKAFTSDGNVIFDREQDSSSESTHGRWQTAETHFNDTSFGVQDGVVARAKNIVFGGNASDGFAFDQARGLRYPQWNINLAWFAQDVPSISGVKNHMVCGNLITIELKVFGTSGIPLVNTLPMRSVRISFPSGKADGTTYVRFDGTFGLQMDDPKSLWNYLIRNQERFVASTVATTTGTSTSTVYGAIGTFIPTPATDGVTAAFSIPFGYIPGTLQVFLNGLEQRPGIDFFETNPDGGGFSMASAPYSTDNLYAICRTLSS